MAKDKIAYVCDNCGQESAKWIGKCPSCGQWNTFREIRIANDTGQQSARSAAREVSAARRPSVGGRSSAMLLRDIPTKESPRMDMYDAELNRVLEHRTFGRRPWNRKEYADPADHYAYA